MGFGVAVAAIGVVLSCRQIVGITDSPPETLTTNACGLPYGATACASCINAHCCSESSTCAGDADCAPFFQCTGGCTVDDWTCRAQCWTDHRPGQTKTVGLLHACEAESCADECGFACGNGALFAPPDAAASCTQCLTTNRSCPAQRACTSSVECAGAELCFGGCFGTVDCRCTPSTDGGVALYSTAGNTFGSCGAACGVGINWSCLGHVAWPATRLTGSTFTVQALDANTYGGVSGLDVSTCYAGSDCSAPYAGGGPTDSSGTVTFEVAPGAQNSGHGLEDTNYLQVTSKTGAVVPALDFWGFPVSQATFMIWKSDSTGVVLFYVSDCDPVLARSAGVQVSFVPSDLSVSEYYAQNGNPNLMAKETDGAFNPRPAGGLINVQPGTVTLTATVRAIGKAFSTATVLVRAGTITYVHLFPNPP
jgi:hypothetical protein